MILAALVLSWLFVPPDQAAYLAARMIGRPDIGRILHAICRRESRCTTIGIYRTDAWAGQLAYQRAVRAKKVRPDACPFHFRGDPSRWSTRGAYGTIAAYTVHHLGPCVPPESLDVPILAALAAAKRIALICSPGRCTKSIVRQYWRGKGHTRGKRKVRPTRQDLRGGPGRTHQTSQAAESEVEATARRGTRVEVPPDRGKA